MTQGETELYIYILSGSFGGGKVVYASLPLVYSGAYEPHEAGQICAPGIIKSWFLYK